MPAWRWTWRAPRADGRRHAGRPYRPSGAGAGSWPARRRRWSPTTGRCSTTPRRARPPRRRRPRPGAAAAGPDRRARRHVLPNHEGGFARRPGVPSPMRWTHSRERGSRRDDVPAILYDHDRARSPDAQPRDPRARRRASWAAGRSDVRHERAGHDGAGALAMLAAPVRRRSNRATASRDVPLHAAGEEPELPARSISTEVSHHHGGRRTARRRLLHRPRLPPYPVRRWWPRGPIPARRQGRRRHATARDIDYYAMLDQPAGVSSLGLHGVFGFRPGVLHPRRGGRHRAGWRRVSRSVETNSRDDLMEAGRAPPTSGSGRSARRAQVGRRCSASHSPAATGISFSSRPQQTASAASGCRPPRGSRAATG